MSPLALFIVVEVVAVAAFFGSLALLFLGIGIAIAASLSAAAEKAGESGHAAVEPAAASQPTIPEPALSVPRPRTRRRHVSARSRSRGLMRVRS